MRPSFVKGIQCTHDLVLWKGSDPLCIHNLVLWKGSSAYMTYFCERAPQCINDLVLWKGSTVHTQPSFVKRLPDSAPWKECLLPLSPGLSQSQWRAQTVCAGDQRGQVNDQWNEEQTENADGARPGERQHPKDTQRHYWVSHQHFRSTLWLLGARKATSLHSVHLVMVSGMGITSR